MSTMNPLKFVGGMILEIGAVVAVLAILPAMGTRSAMYPAAPSLMDTGPNQVFFDATSSRLVGEPTLQPLPRAVRHGELNAPPPVAQQRYVEHSLDHSSQRALDAATRIWNQPDQLLPPELRVRREAVPESHYAPRSAPTYGRY